MDLPTPPLPEPTQITFLTARERALGQPAAAAEPLLECLLLLVESTSKPTVTRARRPSSALTLCVTAFSKWERIGQPAVVRETTHVHAARVGLLDRADHPEGDDVLAQLGVDDAAQGVVYLFLGGHRDPV